MQQIIDKILAILGNISKTKMNRLEALYQDIDEKAFEDGFNQGHEHAVTNLQRPPDSASETRHIH